MPIRAWLWEDVSSEEKVEQGWWGWLMHGQSVSVSSESTQSQLLCWPGKKMRTVLGSRDSLEASESESETIETTNSLISDPYRHFPILFSLS